MKTLFLSSASDTHSRRGGRGSPKGRNDGSLFWWTIIITLLMGLATFCWFFSIMVFKYPEKPFHYRLLSKLDKLEAIKNFDPLNVPHGAFYGARELLAKYYNYNADQLRLSNDLLKRSYITNYMEESPLYIKGGFSIVQSRPLTSKDIIDVGWVVRIRSTEVEDVDLELILPGAVSEVEPYQVGEKITMDNKSSFVSVVNIEKNSGGDGLCATVIPIAYGSFTIGKHNGVSLKPPAKLNMSASLPVLTRQDGASVASINK